MGDDHGFDRARSSGVDSGVGDDPKSSKTYKRQRRRLRNGRLSLLRVQARETELAGKAFGPFLFPITTCHNESENISAIGPMLSCW